MRIRAAVKKDLKAIKLLFSIPALLTATGKSLPTKMLEKYLDKKYFLVAEEKNKIIAGIFGERLKVDGMLLWEFAVKKGNKDRGIGSALLNSFELNMKLEKRKWLILYAPANNKKLLQFYRKRGFIGKYKFIEFIKIF